MDLLNVLAEVAKATGVEVPESDYGAITTINDFAEYLSARPARDVDLNSWPVPACVAAEDNRPWRRQGERDDHRENKVRTVKTFPNRTAAGRRLAERLSYLRGEAVVVLGLPRGVSRLRSRLHDRWVRPRCDRRAQTRRPLATRAAMGASARRRAVTNDDVLRATGLSRGLQPSRHASAELERRARRFRGDGRRQPLEDEQWSSSTMASRQDLPHVACRIARAPQGGPNRARRAGRAARLALTMRW